MLHDVAHYNFNAHYPILVIFFFAEMMLSEYAIKWSFVIPFPLASVSALPGETWTQKFVFFSVMFKNNTDFACCIFHIHQPILIIFGRK